MNRNKAIVEMYNNIDELTKATTGLLKKTRFSSDEHVAKLARAINAVTQQITEEANKTDMTDDEINTLVKDQLIVYLEDFPNHCYFEEDAGYTKTDSKKLYAKMEELMAPIISKLKKELKEEERLRKQKETGES